MSVYTITIPNKGLSEEDIYKHIESASSGKIGIPMKCGITYSNNATHVRYFMLTPDMVAKLQ